MLFSLRCHAPVLLLLLLPAGCRWLGSDSLPPPAKLSESTQPNGQEAFAPTPLSDQPYLSVEHQCPEARAENQSTNENEAAEQPAAVLKVLPRSGFEFAPEAPWSVVFSSSASPHRISPARVTKSQVRFMLSETRQHSSYLIEAYLCLTNGSSCFFRSVTALWPC